jgi:hypothetical protein
MKENRPEPAPRSRFEDEGIPDLQEGTPEQQWAQDPQEMPLLADRPVGLDEYGTTATEMREGESLDMRLSRETPDADPEFGIGDEERGADDELLDFPEDDLPELPDDGAAEPQEGVRGDRSYDIEEHHQAGRLVDPSEGLREDTEKDMVAEEVGPDFGGYAPEEDAMRVEDDKHV